MRKNDLHELIHSLTPAEKRHFKLLATMEKGNKQYMLVFDAILVQKNYDEDALQKLLRKKQVRNSLTKIKGYLYNLVLKSLRSLTVSSAKLRSGLLDFEKDFMILYFKGLYNQCDSRMKKAQKIAEEFENWTTLINLDDYKTYTLPLNRLTIEDIDAHFSGMLHKIKLLENEIKFYSLDIKARCLVARGTFTSDKDTEAVYAKILSDPLMQSEDNALSYVAKSHYYECLQFYYYSSENRIGYYDVSLKVVQHMESRPRRSSSNYALKLLNLAFAASHLGKLKEVEKILTKISGIKNLPEHRKREVTLKALSIVVHTCARAGIFSKAKKIIETDIHDLLGQKDRMDLVSNSYIYSLYLEYATVYFGVGDFDKALYWCSKVLNETNISSLKKYIEFGKLLELFIHFELGSDRLLSSLLSNTKRFLIKKKCYSEFERSIIETLENVLNSSDKKEKTTCYIELRRRMDSFEARFKELESICSFNYIAWVESKIQNRSYAAILREKAKALQAVN